VTKHVRMDWKIESGFLTSSGNHFANGRIRQWSLSLGNKDVR
jgi:hypothetical protein